MDDQIKEDQMVRACNRHGKHEKYICSISVGQYIMNTKINSIHIPVQSLNSILHL